MEVMSTDYTPHRARAKGASERRVIIRHALRNGLIPLVTLIGCLAFAGLMKRSHHDRDDALRLAWNSALRSYESLRQRLDYPGHLGRDSADRG